MEYAPLNHPQISTLRALIEIEGWATHRQLRAHGGNSSSADFLERAGFVECRDWWDGAFGLREMKINELGMEAWTKQK